MPSSTLPSTNSTNDTPPKKRSRLVVPEGFLSPVKETSSPSQQLLKERQAATPKPAQRTEVLDSEDEDSLSSDDSLVDLAELFKPKQNNLQSPPKLQTPIKKRRGKIIVSSPRIERISTTHKFKFDIKSLAKDDETKKKQDEQAARVKNLLSLPPPILTPVGEVDSGATTPTVKLDSTNQAELLSTVVTKKLKHTSSSDPIDGDDDPDAVQKVLRAMKRTGAGLQDLGWYFFTPHPSSTKPPPFDMSWTSYKWQVDIFFDEEELTNGLQDGLLLNLAKASGGLPKPIIEWGRIRMVYSQKSLERKAWEKVLLCAPSALKAALTPELISSTFIILGARHESVDLEEKMALVPVTPDHYFDRESKLPRGGEWEVLISFVQLLGHAAERDAIDHDTAEFALAVLCRLAVDTVVERHLTLFNAVRDTTGRLAAVWTDDAEWDEVVSPFYIQSIISFVVQII